MDIEKIGKAIAYLRKRAGFTQRELADRIGISDKAVSKWERGLGLPEIGYLQKLSILLDTDSDSLLTGDVVQHRAGWQGIILLEENTDGIGAGTIVYDKPLIYFLLSYFMLVGIKEIYVACDKRETEYIEANLGDGGDYGVKITTVVGGLKAVAETMTEKKNDDAIMLLHGRCILYGVDQTRFFQKAMINRRHLTRLALPKKMNHPVISIDENKRVLNGHDHTEKLRTQYDYSELPILFFPLSLLKSIAEAPSIESFTMAQKEKGLLYIEVLDRGFVEIAVDNWKNVQEAATFLRIVQEKCGMNVYCLEEVAWRRGMIGLDKLKELGERKSGTLYGDYVLEIYERMKNRTNQK